MAQNARGRAAAAVGGRSKDRRPVWMWSSVRRVKGHERMEMQIPGLAAVARTIAEPIRRATGGLVRRAYPREELIQHPAFHRFGTDQVVHAALLRGSPSIEDEWQSFAAPLEVWCNLEIH